MEKAASELHDEEAVSLLAEERKLEEDAWLPCQDQDMEKKSQK